MDQVDGFDWRFFGISPREARTIDPQHRLLLEVAWEALEDGGMPAARIAGDRAGVFVGIMLNDYGRLYGRDLRAIDGYTSQNNTFGYAANRISFFFDLRGPSMALDTACSSSLLAFHEACRSVWTGESEWALAGGVSLILAPDVDISMSKATALSPTGRVRTWDEKADGYVRGEGAGVVVIKPLAAALQNHDRIYALVLGTAANHKGRSNWLVEPSSVAQRDAILAACEMAGVRPDAIDYVELHGTGTPKGDPVEAEALGWVMAARPDHRPCRVGSIKTNIGHLDAAAGIFGLLKAALCLRHRMLVPSLHFETCNPRIDTKKLKLQVQTAAQPWPETGAVPTAGVTSIGFGGVNVHAVLRAFDSSPPFERTEESHVFTLSAKGHGGLAALAERFAGWLDPPASELPTLGDLCYTLAARRTHHEHRLAVSGSTRESIVAGLRGWLDGDRHGGRTNLRRATKGAPRVVFAFPGQGAQWPGMARDLIGRHAAFTDAIRACDALIAADAGWSAIDVLLAPAEASRLDEPEVIQPVLFAVQVALVAQWRAWGIVPSAVVGQSFGEIAAAAACGAITLDEGVRIVCARGRVTQRRAGLGGVAVVDLPVDAARALLLRYETLEIGGANTRESTIITGGLTELDALVAELEARDVFARRVNAGYASHSRDMDCLLDDFAVELGRIEGRTTEIAFCSSVQGRLVDGSCLGTDYWVRNLRDPVCFADAISALGVAEESVFIEISPHPVATAAIEKNLEGARNVLAIVPSLQRGRASLPSLDESLARLYAAGCDPDWAGRYSTGCVVSTPTYCWQRERMWIDPPASDREERSSETLHPLLGRRMTDIDATTLAWEQTVGGPATAYFADHCIQGIASLSTSAMVEMIATAASATLGTGALDILDLELRRAFILPPEGDYRVQTLLRRGVEWTAEVRGRSDQDGSWRTHATARVRVAAILPETFTANVPLVTRLTRADCYRELATLGLQYGPAFQGIDSLWREGDAVRAELCLPAGLDARPYFFHPALHDAALHVAVLAEACRGHSGFVPVHVARIAIRARPEDTLRSHAHVREVDGVILADVRIENSSGEIVEWAEGITLAHLDDGIVGGSLPDEEASWLYQVQWVPLDHPGAATDRRAAGGLRAVEPKRHVWLVLSDRSGVGANLAQEIRAAGLDVVELTREPSADASGSSAPVEGSQDLARRILALLPQGAAIAGAVHLWSLDLPDVESVAAEKVDASMQTSCGSALHLVRALEETALASFTPVWFVTTGSQAWALDRDRLAPLQAPLWGLARAIAVELPSRWGGLVDLDPAAPAADRAARLWAWLQKPRAGEDEVLFRGDSVYGARLVRRRMDEQPRRRFALRQDSAYLVTGGTGGLGLTVARWLAERGARRLVLAARTPLPDRRTWPQVPDDSPFVDAIRAIVAIEAMGATVAAISLDVADERAVRSWLEERKRTGEPPVRGVFHLAGTVHIEDVLQVNEGELLQILRPKIHGTLALHRMLPDLDSFVLFSSASTVVRSPRLGHYAAGNAFLDAMAHYRRARGAAASAIDWGLWSEVGFIRTMADRGPGTMRGMKSIAPEQGVRILEHLARSGDVQTVVWPPDWKQWVEQYPSFARSSFIAGLLGENGAGPTEPQRSTMRARVTEAPEAERNSLLLDHVAREVAAQLRLPLTELSLDLPLGQLGFDSLQATELQARLQREFGVRIPVLRMLGFSAIRTIAGEVSERLESASGPRLSSPEAVDAVPSRRTGLAR